MDPALESRDLGRCFGTEWVVRHVTFHLEAGKVMGLVGPNGAGKTTTLRMVTGLLRPTNGTAHIGGIDVWGEGVKAKRHLGAFIEEPAFHPHLSGRLSLVINGRLAGLSGSKAESEADRNLERVGLTSRGGDPVKTYSRGMRQRLGLAQALLGNPTLLILDEPQNGLDPEGVDRMRSIVAEERDRGATLVISSHLLTDIERMCDEVGVIAHGTLRAKGTLLELTEGEAVTRFQVDQPAEAKTALEPLLTSVDGLKEATVGPSEVTVSLPDAEAIGTANRLLIEAGIRVTAVTTDQPSLESVFRRLVMEETP